VRFVYFCWGGGGGGGAIFKKNLKEKFGTNQFANFLGRKKIAMKICLA